MSTPLEKLDSFDKKILKILQEDGCISNLDLANKIGLSATPTFERVKKLEKMNLIKGYHAEVDSRSLGLGIETFMLVSLSNSKANATASFIRQVHEIDEIVECHRITGTSDYLFKIMVKDITAYEHLAMEKIRKIKEIGQIESLVILSTIKKSHTVPMEYK